MASDQELQSDFSQVVERVRSYKIDTLLRQGLPAEFRFATCTGPLTRLFQLLDQVPEVNRDQVPSPVLSGLTVILREAEGLFGEIRDFDHNATDAKTRHSDMVQRVEVLTTGVYKELAPVVAYQQSTGPRLQNVLGGADQSARAVRETAERAEALLKEKLDEAEKILKAMRQSAVETGVTRHAARFSEAATEFKSAARLWLGATVVLWR